ncbi:hypothetical protein PMAYCL1PPCAC_24338, partial [Pristionchus mayeri]
RKKLNELENIEKLKKQSDERVQKLKKEIFEMKSLRVRMTKQMRAEIEKYREYKMIADKKIVQMQVKERKRDTDTARLKHNLSQQLVVVKRKYEEANAANKRLQTQLMRSKMEEGERKMDEKTDEKWKEHVHNELELVASIYCTEWSTEEMINQRKTLSRTLKGLSERLKGLEEERSMKFRKTEGGEEDDESERTLMEEKRYCEDEMEKMNAVIQSMQSNTSNVNLSSMVESRWNTVCTVPAAKLALKHLFEETANFLRTSMDEQRKREKEEMKWKKKMETLKGDVKERERRIDEMEKQKEEYLRNEKVQMEKRRSLLQSEILESERVHITHEHMDQLKEMQDTIQGMDNANLAERRTVR